jgi:hypothetical protein
VASMYIAFGGGSNGGDNNKAKDKDILIMETLMVIILLMEKIMGRKTIKVIHLVKILMQQVNLVPPCNLHQTKTKNKQEKIKISLFGVNFIYYYSKSI